MLHLNQCNICINTFIHLSRLFILRLLSYVLLTVSLLTKLPAHKYLGSGCFWHPKWSAQPQFTKKKVRQQRRQLCLFRQQSLQAGICNTNVKSYKYQAVSQSTWSAHGRSSWAARWMCCTIVSLCLSSCAPASLSWRGNWELCQTVWLQYKQSVMWSPKQSMLCSELFPGKEDETKVCWSFINSTSVHPDLMVSAQRLLQSLVLYDFRRCFNTPKRRLPLDWVPWNFLCYNHLQTYSGIREALLLWSSAHISACRLRLPCLELWLREIGISGWQRWTQESLWHYSAPCWVYASWNSTWSVFLGPWLQNWPGMLQAGM